MPVAVQNAVPLNLLDNVAIGVQNGATFALPVKLGGLSWQTVYGTVPTSLTVNLQISNDGVNFQTIDTSTNTAGELRTVPSVTALFIRATISANVGGTTVTVILVYKGTGLSTPVLGALGTLLYTNVKQTGNVGGAIQSAWDFVLPANTLLSNGDSLVVEALSQSANNANNKLTAITTGTTTVASESAVPTTNLPRLHRCHIIRTGPATAQAWGEVETQGGAALINIGTPLTDDWRTNVTISFKIQGGGADNDVIHRMSQIYYYPITGTYVGL